MGLCPFHNEKTPSFSVSPDVQAYYCFGCGASGSVYSFVMQMENISFFDAVNFLANRINYRLPELSGNDENAELKETLYKLNITAAKYFYGKLQEKEGKIASEYLDKRGVLPNIRIRFGLGYGGAAWDGLYKHLTDEGYSQGEILNSGLVLQNKNGGFYDRFHNRLIFPILDAFGKVVGFGGRLLEDSNAAKYINSPDTVVFNKSRNLYGINFARKSREKTLILVEGYMDTIAMHQVGFIQAVAGLGTAFNREHVTVLKRYANSVILLFDSDTAGVNASLKAINVCEEGGLNCKVLNLSGAKDPDEYIQKFGKEAFFRQLSNAQSHVAFQVNQIKTKFDLKNADELVLFTKEVSKVISKLENNVEREAYAQEIARITEISRTAVLDEVNRLVEKPAANMVKKEKRNFNITPGEEGLLKAKKIILSICAGSVEVCGTIKNHLLPEEIDDNLYQKMLEIIYEKRKKTDLAEMCDYFETVEEHKKVSEVFNTDISVYKDLDLSNVVTDLIKKIKKTYLEKQKIKCLENNNAEMLKNLDFKLKNLERLYIKL